MVLAGIAVARSPRGDWAVGLSLAQNGYRYRRDRWASTPTGARTQFETAVRSTISGGLID